MNKSLNVVVLALLLTWGCSVPPTIKDAEQIPDDASIAFGSVEVYEDGELQEWGTRFFGYDHFYLIILPPDTSEAITYKLAKDGVFFWALPPGEYILLGYAWHDDVMQRTGRIATKFSVPESGADTYIGSIEIQANVAMLVPRFEDRFERVMQSYTAKYPARNKVPVKQVMEPPTPVGNVLAFRGQCHDDWQIDCDKRFSGVTPVSPDVPSSTGFPTLDSLLPEFRWKGCSRQDIGYDFILYEAASYAVAGATTPSYTKGHVVAYAEDLKESRWQPTEPLKPDTRYFWSVRLREGNTVSWWSVQSHSTFLLVYMSWGSGQWFQFKTASGTA